LLVAEVVVLLLQHLLLVDMVAVVLVLVTLLKILEEVEVLRINQLQVVLELPVLFSSHIPLDKYLKT
tara:strand:- start:3 stop:203 length:201 start_codon:yes stop_codon:yes gene_type:complete